MIPYHELSRNEIHILLDPERPHWFAGNEKTHFLFKSWQNTGSEIDLVKNYHKKYHTDSAKAFFFVRNFLNHLQNYGFLERKSSPYLGRSHYLKLDYLKELWIHTNNSCNIACKHCLVNSSPKEDPGPPTEVIQKWMAEAVQLGVERFYFTGGEPFYRKDIIDLIKEATLAHKKELVIITNGMLLTNDLVKHLNKIPPDLLKIQISLDGAKSETNDAIRGKGSFEKAIVGLKNISCFEFEKTITTVVHPKNIPELTQMPQLAKELGVGSMHLMWPHLRGRFEKESTWKQQVNHLKEEIAKILEVTRLQNVFLDNYESIKWKVNGKPGVKFDLAGAGWESLCIYSNGNVYPSAAFANHEPLKCGNLKEDSLESIWKKSSILNTIRESSLIQTKAIQNDPYRFLVGGGDIEHAYYFSNNGTKGQFTANDPYYPLYQYFAEEALFEISEDRKIKMQAKNGYDGPLFYHVMGDGTIDTVPEAREVATLHSNCVLGFDVEKPRLMVQKFYGQAAEKPQKELCCPITFDPKEIKHIPQAVIERFYGCGSPVLSAQIQPGETFMDLGSGAGIDCYIAAKKVGPKGKVIGIDMTENMLEVARENLPIVSKNLGYNVVEFREGFLEKIPIEEKSVDVITSNCVINLSPDKKAVFHSMWKSLKDGGRIVISDIISGKEVPVHMRLNPVLWGECLSGSLTQEELFRFLESTGFYGLEVLGKIFWKQVEGCDFHSLTFRAYKYEKKAGCEFKGHKAIYLGPFKGVTDEEGHYFPRNFPIEICTDTCNKLSVSSMIDQFTILLPNGEESIKSPSGSCCDSKNSCC